MSTRRKRSSEAESNQREAVGRLEVDDRSASGHGFGLLDGEGLDVNVLVFIGLYLKKIFSKSGIALFHYRCFNIIQFI